MDAVSHEPKRTAQEFRGVAPRLLTPSARSSAVGASHKSGDQNPKNKIQKEKSEKIRLITTARENDANVLGLDKPCSPIGRTGRCPTVDRPSASVRAVSFAAHAGSGPVNVLGFELSAAENPEPKCSTETASEPKAQDAPTFTETTSHPC